MGRTKVLIVVCLSIILAAGIGYAADREYIQAKVFIDDFNQFPEIQKMGLDIIWIERGSIDIVTDSEELAELESLGFKTEIVHQDLVAFYQSRLPDKSMGGYKTYGEVTSDLMFQHLLYPDIVSERISIGQSLEGRDIWAIKISDNPDVDEDEPEVLYTGTIHAREVICPHVLQYFVDYLCENYGTDPRVTDLVDNREIWIVPVVNPDGHVYNELNNPSGGGMWRKNRRDNGDGTWGVDLNRNYGYMWGYDDIGSSPDGEDETYRGTGPFSEPETQVMRDFTYAHDFGLTVYYHSSASVILWPMGWTTEPTADEPLFYAIADTLAAFNHYGIGSGAIGYGTNGGSDDWQYGELGQLSYVIEVGRRYSDGFWPDPSRIDSLCEENLESNLLFAEYAADPHSVFSTEQPTLVAPEDVVEGDPITVDWSVEDTLNPAVQYSLLEMQNQATITDTGYNMDNWDPKGYVIINDYGYNSTNCFYSGTPVRYLNYLQSKYPYLVQPNDTLTFKIQYCINEGWDYGYVDVSTDGGRTFTPIPGNITTTNDPYAHTRGPGISGYTEEQWVDGIFDLSAFEGQEIYVRFSLENFDVAWACYGMLIDNISPITTFETIDVIADDIADTTYTFTGRTEGDYYYRVRPMDADGQWGRFSNIAGVSVKAAYLCGDPNDDEAVNLLDVLYLIDFVYGDPTGPAPIPPEAGDANADGSINLLDILYLIDFLYGVPPGPEPLCP